MELKEKEKENELNFSNVINEMGKMNRESKKIERRDIFFKLLLVMVLIEASEYVARELIGLLNYKYLLYTLTALIVPFLKFVAIAGLYVGLMNYHLGADYFYMRGSKWFFRHNRKVLLLSELFIVFIINALISLITFGPLLYLVIDLLGPEVNLYFVSFYLIENYLLQTIIFAFIGMTISGFISNAFVAFYFNTTYNSLVDEHSGFWWNFKGSVRSYMNDDETVKKSVLIEALFAAIRIVVLIGIVKLATYVTQSKNAVELIIITNVFRAILVALFALIDTEKMLIVSKLISENVERS